MSKNKNKATRNKYKWLVIILLVILLPSLAALFVGYQAMEKWPGNESVRIYIPDNSTRQAIADTLTTRLGDYGGKVARLWNWQNGRESVARGSYVIEPGTTALQMSRKLLHGRQTPVKVTFNNIRTLQQLADKVAGYMEFGPEDFLTACDTVLSVAGYKAPQYIAAFMPDTYEFYWTTSPVAVVDRLTKVRDNYWNETRQSQAKTLGLSPVQVAIVASIAEEETNKPDELGRVARLYLNRLDKGMMLQADPTVKYAVGDFALRRIGKKQLAVESPYNTYLHAGLPPGPIRLASQRAIDAVLAAPKHSYLYMCAKEDFSGYHNFATDFNAHQANARRYQAELNRRGIR